MELFSRMIPHCNEFGKIKCYAAVQLLRHRMEADNFWIFPHAAFKNERIRKAIEEKLDCMFDPDFFISADYKDTFNDIFDQLNTLSLKDFMRIYLPDFITQPEYVFDILEKVQFDEYKCLALILSKTEWLNNCGADLPVEIYSRKVHKIFTSAEWVSLSYAVNCYAFKHTTKLTKAAQDATLIFRSYHCPEEYQIALYGDVREKLVGSWIGKHRKWQSHITNGAHYIRKINNQNPQIDALGMDEAINKAAERIGNIERPTDFLQAVMVNASSNDSKIENDFVFSKFIGRLSKEDCVAVINPSPDFLCQYPEEFMESTTFVVPYDPMVWVLEQQFPSADFVSFEDFCHSSSGVFPMRDIPTEVGIYSKILLFSRQLSKQQLDHLVWSADRGIKEDGTFFAVVPSECITGTEVRQALDLVFSLKKIDLLPQKAFNSTPKKKIFVEATPKFCGSEIQVTDYEFFRGTDDKIYLKKVFETPIAISARKLSTPKSIYTVYREQIAGKTGEERIRKHPHSFSFTPEVFFWYTVTSSPKTFGPKVEAYTCYLPTETQKKRRLFLRGNKVKKAYASVSRKVDIDEWCENILPFDPRIHKGVVDAFKKSEGQALLTSGNISLKTIWYLQLKPEELQSSPQKEAEVALFSSIIGRMELNSEEFSFESEMEIFCENKSVEETAMYWNILHKTIEYAVKNGYIKTNPTDEFVRAFREKRDTATAEVRAALMKKTFRFDEEQRLLSYLFDTISEKPEYLSVLIRFFTGLEPNIVSALTWGDIHQVANTDMYQLWIYQQCKNNGETPIPLEFSEDYRRIPIAPTLYRKLQIRLKDIQSKTGLSPKALNSIQIIATDAQIKDGKQEKRITPRKINSLSKDAVNAIGIPDIVVDLPDEENGTKETNLASYRGDIFRSNFRYRASFQCGFTESETRYILGLQQTSPFGKNYCDYLNSFSQLSLYQKLCRWDLMYSCTKPDVTSMQVSLPYRTELASGQSRTSAHFMIPVGPETGEVSVRVDSKHGLHIQAGLSAEEENCK